VYDFHSRIALAEEHRNQLLLEAQNARLIDEARRYNARQAARLPRSSPAWPSLRLVIRRMFAPRKQWAAN
jgi:hypothetical protein